MTDTVPMDPVLVLLPGLDGTRHLFEPFLRAWPGESIVVSYPRQLPSDYPSLLPVVLDALPEDREFILLGWSFSGPLALMAAALRPAGLRGLILCASFVTKPIPWVPKLARHVAWPALFGFTGALSIAKTVLAGHGSKEVNELIKRAHGEVPSAVMAARVRALLAVDVREQLASCPVPAFYLAAKGDRVVPHRNARQIQRIRPDVEVRFIPGPHIALATHPAEAAAEIGRFVAALPGH